MTREFNAPQPMVFEALTKPDLLLRWFHGPDGWTLTRCELDLRAGGRFRYEWRGDDGTVMGVGGTVRAVDAPRSFVMVEKFDEAWYPGEAVTTTALTEAYGRTTLTMTIVYESQAARDEALKSGMEHGVAAGYDKLERLLEQLRAATTK